MLPLPPDHRPSLEELTVRLAGVERRNRRLAGALAAMPVAAILIALGLTEFGASAKADPAVSPILRVRELAVVDDAGVVRARVGSDLPDAIIDGKRIGRGGEKVSGIMLYDGTGQERGGYVTFEPSGNIGLTLDSAKAQTTLLIAGRDGGSALQLWTRDGAIELRSERTARGSPERAPAEYSRKSPPLPT